MFTGNENHEISFEAAGDLTKRYRDQMSEGDKKGGYFSKSEIKKLLDQDKCVGLRYYYGLYENKIQVMVLVGVDENENDLVGEGNVCLEMSLPCPDNCSTDNILNS